MNVGSEVISCVNSLAQREIQDEKELKTTKQKQITHYCQSASFYQCVCASEQSRLLTWPADARSICFSWTASSQRSVGTAGRRYFCSEELLNRLRQHNSPNFQPSVKNIQATQPSAPSFVDPSNFSRRLCSKV